MSRKLRGMTNERIHELAEAVDAELDRQRGLRVQRGYRRSTYMTDRIRGRRKAPRLAKAA